MSKQRLMYLSGALLNESLIILFCFIRVDAICSNIHEFIFKSVEQQNIWCYSTSFSHVILCYSTGFNHVKLCYSTGFNHVIYDVVETCRVAQFDVVETCRVAQYDVAETCRVAPYILLLYRFKNEFMNVGTYSVNTYKTKQNDQRFIQQSAT